eukprot:scaffold662126_cov41-Prasinocladus_malaysianus.AAC.1
MAPLSVGFAGRHRCLPGLDLRYPLRQRLGFLIYLGLDLGPPGSEPVLLLHDPLPVLKGGPLHIPLLPP